MMAEFELARKPEKINAVWWMEWIKDGMRELRLNEWWIPFWNETGTEMKLKLPLNLINLAWIQNWSWFHFR